MGVIELNEHEVLRRMDCLGGFAVDTVAQVGELQRSVDALNDCKPEAEKCDHQGEKAPLPVPENLSGEDAKIYVRIRLKQIERCLLAKCVHKSTLASSQQLVWHWERSLLTLMLILLSCWLKIVQGMHTPSLVPEEHGVSPSFSA